jgi:hypothetical protein
MCELKPLQLNFRNAAGKSGMIPQTYVQEIVGEETAMYQDVPSDSSWSDNEDGKDKAGQTKSDTPDSGVANSEINQSDPSQSDSKSISQSQQSEEKNKTLTNGFVGDFRCFYRVFILS